MKKMRTEPDARPKAQEIFTDRVTEQECIASYFARLCASPFAAMEKPVLSFYGAGGIGKSTLLEKIISDWESRQHEAKSPNRMDLLLCDIDKDEFTPDYQPMKFYGTQLRPLLKTRGISTPLFDLLYVTWWSKSDPSREINLKSNVDGLVGSGGQCF